MNLIAKNKTKVLLVADLNYYAKGYFRLKALQRLGANVEAVSHTSINNNASGTPSHSLAFRIAWKLGIHLDTEKINTVSNQFLLSSTVLALACI